MIAMIEAPDRARPCLCGRGPCAVRRRLHAGLRQAVAAARSTSMIAGARVEVAPYKRNPTDFVLWKPSIAEEPGWDSPWGRGRPGWHIECSAMSEALSGRSLRHPRRRHRPDLPAPRERDRPVALRPSARASWRNVWMHNGFLQVEGEKMSKSLGNFVTIRC